MTKIMIRQAVKQDTTSISKVLIKAQWFTYKNLYSEKYIEEMIHQYYNSQRIEQEITNVSSQWHGYFVAEELGEILGVIGGGMVNQTTGEVYVFYLLPETRNKGIGTRLLNFFTKIQKYNYGATEQWVSVAKGNYYGIPFYEARGFDFQYEAATYGSDLENDRSLKYKRDI